MTLPLPTPSQGEALTLPDRRAGTHWYRFFDQLRNAIASLYTQTWELHFFVETPTNSDYRVIVAATVARTITSVTTRSASGTATLTVKINTTALGGTANSVSSSEQTQAHTTANAMVAGDDLVLTFSAVSSPSRVTVTISGTRTF